MINASLHLNPGWQTGSKQATRDGFGEALVGLAQTNDRIAVVTADLAESTKVDLFAKMFPNRFFDVGVAEQNLMGIGAGLASVGFIPFCTSYAVFSPGRNWEQLRVSVCYSNANVKVVSTHAGITVGADGATHQGLEDIALTRVLPNLIVISPCDAVQAKRAMEVVAKHKGPVYLRLSREKSPDLTTGTTPFNIGKAQVFRFGEKVTLVATGIVVAEALKAAAEIDGEVINIHTIKPLDIDTIVASVKKTGKLIVVEDHQVAGGLGSSVAEGIVRHYPAPMKCIGINDRFGQSGAADELLNEYGLTWHHIVAAAKSF